MINQNSGAAGLLHWITTQFHLPPDVMHKRDPRLKPILDWIQNEYERGRVTAIGDQELEEVIARLTPELYTELLRYRNQAEREDQPS